ncbi:hypothetical protein CS063_11960 [Sporanaerobium hydrogeniformans]|uniref:Uncharacterized protein n=1 Tax=Sporanaerobium hydrogeniformans TaxID=3072179 RepID=A0AC61DA89_9FIRM|nr:hypothetical protein [Sporanaerobium hydrogeniformans]PHV70186.1 hypothetical protein CS063_11960 [Sporanaerobium hydrogeniformans]
MLYLHFVALIPFYDERGQNSTCVLFKDGSKEYFSCSIKAYITKLLYQLHLDPRAIRFWTSQVLGAKLNTPLIIDETHILLPVKFRKPVTKQDGCFGYVNNVFIQTLEDYCLTLSTGQTLAHLSTKSYLLKKQKDAAFLSYAYTDYKKQYEFMWKD